VTGLRASQFSRLLVALSVALLSALLLAPPAAAEKHRPLRQLREAWIYFEVGNLRSAERSFLEALETPGGSLVAEVHYGLSLVQWKKLKARESYHLLQVAQGSSRKRGWDGGDGDEWDHRIAGRIRYIERNFSAVTLRHPMAGKPLEPFLDPPPRDPLLLRFAGATEGAVREGSVGPDGAQRMFLPSGGYWVGDKHVELVAGKLAAGQQQVLYLPLSRGPVLKRHKDRKRMQEEGVAIPIPGEDPGLAPGAQARVESTRAAPRRPGSRPAAEALPPPEPLDFPVVRSYLSERTAEELSERWTAVPFHIQYSVYCPDGDAEHQFSFPDYDFYVRFDPGGTLRIKGVELLRVNLGTDWHVGDSELLNQVELRFDGTTLTVMVNGLEFGPVRVRAKAPQQPGQWKIRMSDDRARITYLSVRPLS